MSEALEIRPTDALILVDLQNDFCPGGSLAVPDGDRVIPVLNDLARRFETVVATRDWHPADHCSFAAQGGPWPPHCVQETPGAEHHPDLDLSPITFHVIKAFESDQENYDNFGGRPDLAAELRQRGIERVFIGGLATDYCVLNTVLGALRHGFEVVAVTDGMAAVEVEEGDGERALAKMESAGARLAQAKEIGRS